MSRIYSAKSDNRWGLIDSSGKWLLEPEFASISIPNVDGVPGKREGNSAWAMFTLSGQKKFTMPNGTTNVGVYSEGVRCFHVGTRWGFFDVEQGAQLIEPRFQLPNAWLRGSRLLEFVGGEAAVMIPAVSDVGVYGATWMGIIARDGSWLVEPAPNYQGYGDGSLVIYPIDGPKDEPPWGLDVRSFGRATGPNLRVPFSIADDICSYRQGFAPIGCGPLNAGSRAEPEYFPAHRGEKGALQWGLVDYAGRVVVPTNYEEVRPFSENRAAFRIGNLWGFLDSHCEVAVEPMFLEVEYFADGCSACQSTDEQWGVIDSAGNWIVEPRFERLVSEQRPLR